MALSGVFGVLASSAAISAEQAAPAERAAVPAPPDSAKVVLDRGEWRRTIIRTPRPKRDACFKVDYPRLEWQEAPCIKVVPRPLPPKPGPRADLIGNGGSGDFAAKVTSGFINAAEGSFPSASGLTSESSAIGNVGSPVANAYTLQLNTDVFPSTACAGSPNPGCGGWEQFVFENDGGSADVYIQYWLIQYNTTCPGGWLQFMFPPPDTDIYCFRNGPGMGVPAQAVTDANLMQMILHGEVSASADGVTMTTGSGAVSTPGINAVAASAGWKEAEFNIFGDAGGSEAIINGGAAVTVQVVVHNGTTNAPVCDMRSFTGETNSMTLQASPAIATGASPRIEFLEGDPSGLASCAAASGIGDVHLTTLSGLYYDFQAAGDFLQLADGNGFAVQTRQVSGAPTWPSATINKEVGARFGKTRVAICQAPTRVEIDGRVGELNDGQRLSLPDGTVIWRSGNVYSARGANGDGFSADVVGPYINLYVGLGHPPTAATRGLMVNPNGNPNQIATRSGAVLNEPVSFSNLYDVYGDSWRVPREESLMCKDERIETGNPKAPFYADNLEPQVRERAQAVCNGAGVKVPALLESCIIDVAVLGKESAAKVFTTLPAPVAVGQAGMRCRESAYGKCPGDGGRKY